MMSWCVDIAAIVEARVRVFEFFEKWGKVLYRGRREEWHSG